MKCPKCGYAIKEIMNFCPNCSQSLIERGNKTITAGDQSVNIIGDENNVDIRPIVTTPENPKVNYEFQVGKKLFKSRNVNKASCFVAAIGFIGSVASIISFVKNDLSMKHLQLNDNLMSISLLILLFGVGGLFLYNDISKRRFVRVLPGWVFGFNLQLLNDDKIALIKVTGKCPICGSNVKLAYIKYLNNSIGICERYPQEHRFTFDYTDFEENKSGHIYDFDHTNFTATRIKK